MAAVRSLSLQPRPPVLVRFGPVSLRVNLRLMLLIGGFSTFLVLLCLWAGTLGSFPVPLNEVLKAAFGESTQQFEFIVRTLRMPRILTAVFVGAMLATSGAIFQGLVRNPLVSPDLIGINAGASVAAVYWIVEGQDPRLLPFAAFGGAVLAAALIYVLAWKGGVSGSRLILVGIGINAILGAATTFLLVKYPIERVSSAVLWSVGSVYGSDWGDVETLGIALLFLIPVSMGLMWSLRVLQFGDETAASLGMKVELTRLAIVLAGCALAATAVAIAGPIGFVALIVPHVARMIAGPMTAGVLLLTAILGSILLLGSDIVAQHYLPVSLPVGVVTAAIGAPYFLFLLYKGNVKDLAQMSRLQAENVTLAYLKEPVVTGLTTSFPDSKITAIIGPNGCGKSTLLRSLARLLKPRGGTVILDGEAIQRQSTKEVARRLGLLAQQPTTPEAITVEDLVRRGRYPHQSFFQLPTATDQEMVERAMALAGVEDLRDRPVDELSGGQRQRAWIAMTLAQDTGLLLMDEPTTYLDIAHQHEVLELVMRLNREEGKTIILVLHDLNQAARVGDHVIAMRDGVIVAEGDAADVITTQGVEDIFGLPMDLVRHPATGEPVCIPANREHLIADESSQAEGATGPNLQTKTVVLGYGPRVVVQGVSVEFPAGKISSIVGPNACGKSTLFRSLSRLLATRSGEITMAGRPVNSFSRRNFAQRLGLLTQSPLAPPDVTVEDLVAGGRYPHQRWYRQWSHADEEAVQAAMRATNTTEMRYQRVDSLSGGQKQRAWIAMALAQDTPVLLLDEPTTFLDIAHQVELMDLIKEMNRRRGTTVVMVLHDLIQACRYSDYVVAMKDGQVAAAGKPADVITTSLVRDTFGIDCEIMPDPVTGAPLVLPTLSSRAPELSLAGR